NLELLLEFKTLEFLQHTSIFWRGLVRVLFQAIGAALFRRLTLGQSELLLTLQALNRLNKIFEPIRRETS
ncbi:hypothetical protein CEXT_793781, partial [Caerostris extrusa]